MVPVQRELFPPTADPDRPPKLWTGWARPPGSKRWERIIECDDYDECWQVLLELRGGDKLVSPTGRDPNART